MDTRVSAAPRPVSPFPTNIDDKATASYVRRTLCAHHAISAGPPRSIHELLPPLSSSNAVDLQLYAIIGVILKEFVQAWYGKITPDHAFVDEIIQIIAHCTRALEERLRDVDLEALLLDEIPAVIDGHISAFRIAHQSESQPLAPATRMVYHTMHPHPALEPVPEHSDNEELSEQKKNEQAWRHMLVQSVLAVLLPTEDLQNDCLRSLVEEIVAEMIVGNVLSNRLCEPWALWELITNAIHAVQERGNDGPLRQSHDKSKDEAQKSNSPAKSPASRLAQYGLLNHSSNSSTEDGGPDALPNTARTPSMTKMVWIALNYGIVLFTAGRAVLLLMLSSSKLPLRAQTASATIDTEQPQSEGRPIISMGAWRTAANLMELQKRMPWVSGLLSLAQLTAVSRLGQMGGTNGILDS
ncbi:hypothetical protein BT63DRAFT_275188 [Microthyrium microscopicum]|uniref:PXA domain-containing protein n=1 Tax=Microthyrium microscopicum TaxID=703497 RepID=A0A6A6UAQ6_9PEZI|nr:hypothetical protein BT63DRAFT_275188 [Microthyrium microscopicum]